MDSGKLVVLSAPSGSGKTSLVKELLKEKLNLGFSVSATSRAPRRKEKNNLDYYFLSHDEFVEKINGNAFLEYEEVYKFMYRNLELWGKTELQQDQAIVIIRNGIAKSVAVADPEIKKRGPALPLNHAILGIVRMRTKILRAHTTKQT